MTETPRELDPLVEGFIKFGVSLYHGSRFFSRPTQEIAEALREVIGPLKSKLGPEDHEFFFRARLHDSPRMKEPTGPFQGNDIMNPPGDRALAGRLNCAGISRLYLSSTEDTAAAEVRAITGDFVTIAKLRLREPITAIDFRKTKE